MDLQFKAGIVSGGSPPASDAGSHIITHGSGTADDDADLGVAGARLTVQQSLEVEAVADDYFLVRDGIAQSHGLQLAYQCLGVCLDAPRQLDVPVPCVRPRQEPRDPDPAADQYEPVGLQHRGARVLWIGPVE